MRSSFYLREKKKYSLVKEHCREVLCRKKNKDENVHRYTVQGEKVKLLERVRKRERKFLGH